MAAMRRFARIFAGRQFCLLLALFVLAAPLAAEPAAEAAAAQQCAVADAQGDGGHADADHDHHAHSCGGCHVHLLMVRASAPLGARHVAVRPQPPVADAPVDAPSRGLFRPPRA